MRHALVLVALAALPLSGAECLGDGTGEPGEERLDCEAVCFAEGQCAAETGRTEEQCLEALCNEDGFKEVLDGDDTVDFQTQAANECMKAAADCAELLLCSCPDSCARVDSCLGSVDPTCVDTCENLIESGQTVAEYTENRCQMESTCADLPACGGAG